MFSIVIYILIRPYGDVVDSSPVHEIRWQDVTREMARLTWAKQLFHAHIQTDGSCKGADGRLSVSTYHIVERYLFTHLLYTQLPSNIRSPDRFHIWTVYNLFGSKVYNNISRLHSIWISKLPAWFRIQQYLVIRFVHMALSYQRMSRALWPFEYILWKLYADQYCPPFLTQPFMWNHNSLPNTGFLTVR